MIVKYMLNFVTGHSCSLQSSPLPSSCNTSRVSATAGSTTKTDFMVSHVGPSAVVPEFQIHPKDIALKCAISFWQTQGVKSGV
jgi:hypothetical protein